MNQQYTGVQLLRFVAAMLVVVMHATQAISIYITGQGSGHYWATGSAGVDIFFVISGFVMGITTKDRTAASGSARHDAAWTFIKRRLLRIAPLYWFYTLLKVVLLLAVPALAVRSSIDGMHLLESLLFIPAMSPWGLLEPVLPVGWTLNFEMLFYAVFALSIALGIARIRFCLLAFAAIYLAATLFPQSVQLAFYAQSIIFEFILGIAIAYAMTHWKPRHAYPGALLLLAGTLYIFAIDWSPTADRLATWGLGGAAMVLAVVWLEPWIARSPRALKLSVLGDASYSIYLSHTFVVPATVIAMKALGFRDPAAILSCVVLASALVGYLAHLWLEKPMTSRLRRAFFNAPATFPIVNPAPSPDAK